MKGEWVESETPELPFEEAKDWPREALMHAIVSRGVANREDGARLCEPKNFFAACADYVVQKMIPIRDGEQPDCMEFYRVQKIITLMDGLISGDSFPWVLGDDAEEGCLYQDFRGFILFADEPGESDEDSPQAVIFLVDVHT